MLHSKIPRLKLGLNSKGGSNSGNNFSISRLPNVFLRSIPVLSIFALVGMFIIGTGFINFCNLQSAYAIDQNMCKLSSGGYGYYDPTTGQCIDPNNPDCGAGLIWNASSQICEIHELITPNLPVTPSVSLTVDNGVIHDKIDAAYGTTVYASHTINVNASNIEDYKLTLTPTKVLTGPSTIGNASGQKGSAMAANTWGYGWGATSTNEADLTYNSLASSVNLSGDEVSNNAVNFSKKLVFAANFGNNAEDGTYNASVNLALTVTPTKVVAWNDMVFMQDMSAAACSSVSIGTEKTLRDFRDNSTYTIARLADGNCWMTQNLRIVNKTISSADSDMTSGSFIIPASSTSGFSSDTASDAYYGGNTTYGAYYSWCAATAGSCSNAITAGVNADASICPKGWKLPVGIPGVGTNDFAKVLGLTSTNIAASTSYWDILSNPSFTNGALSVNGTVWPAAGYYNGSAAYDVGSGGLYWSRTASSDTNAYRLNFYNESTSPAYNDGRRSGVSVRCLAYSS